MGSKLPAVKCDNRTHGRWVRSANATSVLCAPLDLFHRILLWRIDDQGQINFYLSKGQCFNIFLQDLIKGFVVRAGPWSSVTFKHCSIPGKCASSSNSKKICPAWGSLVLFCLSSFANYSTVLLPGNPFRECHTDPKASFISES